MTGDPTTTSNCSRFSTGVKAMAMRTASTPPARTVVADPGIREESHHTSTGRTNSTPVGRENRTRSARERVETAFAPSMTPEEFDVQVENGVLTISGERKNIVPPEGATIHIGEHFSGRFRRVVSLPDDIEPNSTTASYRDGVLHVCVARREAAQSRRISVQ